MSNQSELDEILSKSKQIVTTNYAEISKWSAIAHLELTEEAKQAILDWHYKQIEEVIKKPHILPKNAQHQESVKQGINFYNRQMRKRVDRLKESK